MTQPGDVVVNLAGGNAGTHLFYWGQGGTVLRDTNPATAAPGTGDTLTLKGLQPGTYTLGVFSDRGPAADYTLNVAHPEPDADGTPDTNVVNGAPDLALGTLSDGGAPLTHAEGTGGATPTPTPSSSRTPATSSSPSPAAATRPSP